MLILGNRDITEEEKPHINTIQQCIKTSKPAVLLYLEAKRKSWSGWEEKPTTCSKKKQFNWGFKLSITTMGFFYQAASCTWKGSKSPIFTSSFKPSIIWIQKHLQITLTMQGLGQNPAWMQSSPPLLLPWAPPFARLSHPPYPITHQLGHNSGAKISFITYVWAKSWTPESWFFVTVPSGVTSMEINSY